MNESVNPYASSNALGERTSSRCSPLVLLAAGSWLAIAIGVTYVRHSMVPIYADFGVEVLGVTHVLVHPFAPILFGAAAIGISLITFGLPSSQNRKLAALVAIVLGVLTGLTCAYGFFGSLVVTIQQLD